MLPSGVTFDPDTDKVILIGGSGPASSRFGPAPLEVNRSSPMRPARQRIAVGETYDFEFEPTEAGDFRIEVVRGGFAVANAFVTSQLVRITK